MGKGLGYGGSTGTTDPDATTYGGIYDAGDMLGLCWGCAGDVLGICCCLLIFVIATVLALLT